MNSRAIQRADQAGYTKLTAVTVGCRGRRSQFFLMLEHDERGAARLPRVVLNKILDEAGVRRGDTYTVS